MTKIAGSGSISQRQELAVTDLLYNVMNPEHMSLVIEIWNIALNPDVIFH
jgi:hypothetical protein